MREMRVPGIVYVPSAIIGTDRRLGHDRLYTALSKMMERGIPPIAVGVGGEGERWLIDAFQGGADAFRALERLIGCRPTAGLASLCDALEDRLGLGGAKVPEGQLAMTWDMLREMDAHGVETGGHTTDHTVLTLQPLSEARREIAECKAVIEKNLKKPVRHFAYCNGYYSAGVVQALRAEGFVSAVTTEDMPNVPGADPFALKRKVLWERSSTGVFGTYSRALTACQLEDTLSMLSLQQPVIGARPTRYDEGETAEEQIAAHG
jgi:hypothetical protein